MGTSLSPTDFQGRPCLSEFAQQLVNLTESRIIHLWLQKHGSSQEWCTAYFRQFLVRCLAACLTRSLKATQVFSYYSTLTWYWMWCNSMLFVLEAGCKTNSTVLVFVPSRATVTLWFRVEVGLFEYVAGPAQGDISCWLYMYYTEYNPVMSCCCEKCKHTFQMQNHTK